MDYESSDILGSNTLPVRPPAAAAGWSGFSKTVFFLVLLLAAYVGAVRAWAALLKWREKSYRLFMRRQHGIPDTDHRPFNVAYAAVLRARREEEVANNRVHRVDVDELYAEADRRAAPAESDIRQRNPYRDSPPAWTNVAVNGRFNPLAPDNRFLASTSGLPPSSSNPINFAERYNPNPAPVAPVVRFADQIQDSRRSSVINNNTVNSSPRKHQKRALDENEVESDVPEKPKKTRVEGDELIDGDEDAEWVPRQRRQQEKRGEKRVLREEDLDAEEDNENAGTPRRVRGKRARKVSLENPDVLMGSDGDDGADDDMAVDDEEYERRDARAAVARGKKRDAGSSFEPDDADGEAQKTKRKRRTRKSDTGAQASSRSRGQKRDRDGDEEGSEGEEGGTPKRSARKTKKRGKKGREEDEESIDEGSVAAKDKGKGRPIGDEWESNGVLYKIGPNGQRLRQALVKKAARRFTMPVDSQHPDKNANLEVCIETWLTEEEYKDFKSRHLLAWQDSPKGTQEPESTPNTPAAVPEIPSTPTPTVAKGKNLLWDSPASPFPVFAPSPAAEKEQHRPQAHFRQSIAADLGMRVNPFDKAHALHVGDGGSGLRGGRRVGGVRETGVPVPGLADSTNSHAQPPAMRRTFSKWEKQDLEAKAMMKMREANQARQKEKDLKERLEKEKREAAANPVPAISLSKPPAEPAKPPAISFTPSTGAGAVPAASAGAKPPMFSLGAPAPTPTPAAGAAQPPKASFAPPTPTDNKPAQQPTTTPNLFAPSSTPVAAAAAPAPAAIPNPFAKPPAAPAPSSNPFAPTPPAAAGSAPAPAPAPTPATADTNKPSFSFTAAAAGAGAGTGVPKPSFFAPPAAPADRPVAGRKPAESPFQQPPAPAAASGANTGGPTFSFAPQQPQGGAGGGGGGGSLLSRIGGAGAGAAPASASAPAPKPEENAAGPTFSFKPAAGGDQAAAGRSGSPFAASSQQPKPAAFAFNKPTEQPASKASSSPWTSSFAPQPPQQQQPAAPAASQTATPPAPKFNFASATKPAAAAASSPSASSLTGALGAGSNSDSSKQPAAGGFSFAVPKAPENPAPSGGKSMFSFAPAGAEEPKKSSAFGFNFGGGGGAAAPSAFGGASSAFGGGSGAATPSAFGGGAGSGTTTPAAPSAFGGGGASAFGGFGSKPAEEAPKTTAPEANNGAPASGTAPAPAFNFAFGGGNNNASSTPAATPTAFAAKPSAFGGPSVFGKPAEGAASTTPQGSPFGFGAAKPAGTPSVFGGAAATPSVFGAPAKPDGGATTTPSPSPFGAPATSSVFGGGNATGGPSAFGFGSTTPSGFGQQK